MSYRVGVDDVALALCGYLADIRQSRCTTSVRRSSDRAPLSTSNSELYSRVVRPKCTCCRHTRRVFTLIREIILCDTSSVICTETRFCVLWNIRFSGYATASPPRPTAYSWMIANTDAVKFSRKKLYQSR
ncbi:unnamed protein product [Leptidea sinapis]|uniref:Uncharacterized protein n=1 Tax=Leptidea sinapis TaxID=189913 RepID=A0A5E4QSA1_9NEOP|nr:unnamed protein product [Leptidea sinapis]